MALELTVHSNATTSLGKNLKRLSIVHYRGFFFTVPLAVAESLKNTLTVNTTLGQTTCVKTAKYVLILAVILERLLLCASLVCQ